MHCSYIGSDSFGFPLNLTSFRLVGDDVQSAIVLLYLDATWTLNFEDLFFNFIKVCLCLRAKIDIKSLCVEHFMYLYIFRFLQ